MVVIALVPAVTILLFARPAHALPTPDALLGTTQLLPVLLSGLAGVFAAVSVVIWRFVTGRKNPLVFLMRICIGLLAALIVTASYAAYLVAEASNQKKLLNTAEYMRGHHTLVNWLLGPDASRFTEMMKPLGSEISFAELDKRLREDPEYHPVLLTASRYRSQAILDAGGVLAVGAPGRLQAFELSYDIEADIARIPLAERATRDLVVEGASMRHLSWPAEPRLKDLVGSFRHFYWTPRLRGMSRDPRDHMYVRNPDGTFERPNTEASEHLLYPVMKESGIYLDATRIQFPNWMELLSAEEAGRFINNYANPDVILVVPTVSFQMTLKATGYALTHQLPGRFPPGTFSEKKPRAAWDLIDNYPADPSVFTSRGIYVIDYGAKDLKSQIDKLVEVVRGKKFMIVGLARTDWSIPGVDFAYHVWLDSKQTGAPFRYLGGTLVAAEAAATYVMDQAAREHSLTRGAQEHTAHALQALAPRVGGVGAAIALLSFIIWVLTLPIAIFGGRASIWRRLRDRRAETQPYLAGLSRLSSGRFRLSKAWESIEAAIAVVLLFPGFTLLAAPGSPIHGAPFGWIVDLGKPDAILALGLTALVWARVALLRRLGATSDGWLKIAGEAAMFIGFAVLCAFYVPAAIALYALVLVTLRLLTVLTLAAAAKRAMARVASVHRAGEPAANPGAPRPYFERFESLTRVDACGGKAKNLAILARLESGLFEVPKGLALYLDELSPGAPDFDERVKACVRAALPDGRLFAVRSTSNTEDAQVASEAGKYLSLLGVPPDDLPAAVRQVHESYANRGSSGSAVIVQEMVNARIAGVAFSSAPDNPVVATVEWVDGLGDGLVSGEKTPQSASFSRARGDLVLSTTPDLPEEAETIFLASMLLEAAFGAPQDIEWAVVDGRLYLLQARPITRYVHDDAVVTEQRRLLAVTGTPRWTVTDISEIVENPSRLTFSLLQRLYSETGALGRAFTAAGLSTSGLKTDAVFDRLYSRADLGGGVMGALRGRLTSWSARRRAVATVGDFERRVTASYREDRLAVTARSLASLSNRELARRAREVLETFEREIYPLAFEATLRAGLLGADPALAKPVRTVASDYYEALATLCRTQDTTDFLRRWGHRSTSDYDLAVPSFAEDPASAKAFAAGFDGYNATSDAAPGELNPYQVYVQLKERTKDYSVRYLRQVRTLLVELADRRSMPLEDIFCLTVDELPGLGELSTGDAAKLVQAARAAVEAFRRIEMPDSITLCEVETLGRSAATATTTAEQVPTGQLSGQMLGHAKAFFGVAVAASERADDKVDGAILITGTLKPELVGLFDRVSGIITKQGGLLSHAAIVAREKGVPVLRLDRGFEQLSPGAHVKVSALGKVSF
jgi:phosphohistidine swiveling domain-containing protein